MDGMKRCGKCGADKELSAFSIDKSRKDGLYPYCRQCCNKRSAERYRSQNPAPDPATLSAVRSEATKRMWRDPEWRANQVTVRTGKRLPPEHREKMSAAHRARWRNSELHQQYRDRWAAMSTEARRELTLPARIALAEATQPTTIELLVAEALDALSVQYRTQEQIGPWVVDFYLPNLGIALEADGDYWHSKPGVQARDRKRDGWFKANEIPVIRIAEFAIRLDPEGAVRDALRQVLT